MIFVCLILGLLIFSVIILVKICISKFVHKNESFDLLGKVMKCMYTPKDAIDKFMPWVKKQDSFKLIPDKNDKQVLVRGTVKKMKLYSEALVTNELDFHIFLDLVEPLPDRPCSSNTDCAGSGEAPICQKGNCKSIYSELMVLRNYSISHSNDFENMPLACQAVAGELGVILEGLALGLSVIPIIGPIIGAVLEAGAIVVLEGSILDAVLELLADLFGVAKKDVQNIHSICGWLACLIPITIGNLLKDLLSGLGDAVLQTLKALWEGFKKALSYVCKGAVCVASKAEWLACEACPCWNHHWWCVHEVTCWDWCCNCDRLSCCDDSCSTYKACDMGEFDSITKIGDYFYDAIVGQFSKVFGDIDDLATYMNTHGGFNMCADRFYSEDFSPSIAITSNYLNWADDISTSVDKQHHGIEFPSTETLLMADTGNGKPMIWMQGLYVVDNGHGKYELHPMYGLAWMWIETFKPDNYTYDFGSRNGSLKKGAKVKLISSDSPNVGDYPDTELIWRVSVFANSNLHKINKCSLATKERITVWYLSLPSKAYTQNFNGSIKVRVTRRTCKLSNDMLSRGVNDIEETPNLTSPGDYSDTDQLFDLTDFPTDPSDNKPKFRYAVKMNQSDEYGGMIVRDYKFTVYLYYNNVIIPTLVDPTIGHNVTIPSSLPIASCPKGCVNGTCELNLKSSTVNSYCKCKDGYNGVDCSIDCNTDNGICSNHGKCTSSGCVCNSSRYTGKLCESLASKYIKKKKVEYYDDQSRYKFPISYINSKTGMRESELNHLDYDERNKVYHPKNRPDLTFDRNNRVHNATRTFDNKHGHIINKAEEIKNKWTQTTGKSLTPKKARGLWALFYFIYEKKFNDAKAVHVLPEHDNDEEHHAMVDAFTSMSIAFLPELKERITDVRTRMFKAPRIVVKPRDKSSINIQSRVNKNNIRVK